MVDKLEIFKLLLSKPFYESHKHQVDKAIFPEVLQDLYDSLEEAHKQTVNDVSCRELYNIHLIRPFL